MVVPRAVALYLGRSLDEWLGDLLGSELINTAASAFWALTHFGTALIAGALAVIPTAPYCNQTRLVFCIASAQGGKTGISALLKLLTSRFPMVRKAACHALELALREERDPSRLAVQRIAEALHFFESAPVPENRCVEAFDRLDVDWEASEPRQSLELDVLAGLVGRLEDGNADVRFAAIWELFWLSGEHVRSDLLLSIRHAAGDADPHVRKVAATMLDYDGRSHFSKRSRGMTRSEFARWRDDIPAPPAKPPLTETEPGWHPAIQEALAAIRGLDKASFSAAAAALASRDVALRLAAIDVLSAPDRAQPDAADRLLETVKDPCGQVRRKAATALLYLFLDRVASLTNHAVCQNQ